MFYNKSRKKPPVHPWVIGEANRTHRKVRDFRAYPLCKVAILSSPRKTSTEIGFSDLRRLGRFPPKRTNPASTFPAQTASGPLMYSPPNGISVL